MNKVDIIKKFKTGLVCFLDELIEQFPKENDFYLARIMIKDTIPIVDIIKYFTEYIIPHKNLIKLKQKDIVVEKIFSLGINGSVSKEKIERYNKIYDQLHEEDREMVYTWIDFFITNVEEYNKLI